MQQVLDRVRQPAAQAPGSPAFEFLSQQLHALVERIDAGDRTVAADLRALMAELQEHADARCTGLVVFASALAQRVSGDLAQTANLYLRRFEVPQIELFNLLGRCMPVARLATQAANAALATAMRGQAHPTLIDIGIGTGRQVAALLDELCATGALPPELTVIGIEPGDAALAAAEQLLGERAVALGLTLHFHGFARCAETLSRAEWQQLRALCTDRPLLNAAFALHHIADDHQGNDQRPRVLAELLALDPAALVLIEPDVDHLEPRLLPRFRNCFRHFGAVFTLLDGLPLQQAERDALKVGFFGREIHDVLGTLEPLRTERHESSAAWLRRLAAAGFGTQAQPRPEGAHPALRVRELPTHLSLDIGPEPMVAVIVAAPAPRA